MELTVLGAAGTWPTAGGATSGYLLRHDGFNLWVEAGTGTLANLQEHIKMSEVHGVCISHGHPDHFVDLYPFFYARHYGEQGPPGLPLYVPTGFFQQAADLVSFDSQVIMRIAYDVREIEPGASFELGPFAVETRPMAHLGIPALGFRFRTDHAVLAYSGDTGPTHELETIARDADLLLSEATWQDRDDLLPFHLSARQAAEHAARAGAARLMLTHIWPSLEREDSRAQAAEAFDGPIDLAVEGMRLRVGE